MRGTLNLLLTFIACTLGATSVQGQSEALPICNRLELVADALLRRSPGNIGRVTSAFSKLANASDAEGDVMFYQSPSAKPEYQKRLRSRSRTGRNSTNKQLRPSGNADSSQPSTRTSLELFEGWQHCI